MAQGILAVTYARLCENGYLPITFDNLSRGNGWAVKWGPLEKGDLLNLEYLKKVIAKYKPKAVLHFAALAYVGESMQNPQVYFKSKSSFII